MTANQRESKNSFRCAAARDRVDDWLDGLLDDEARAQLDAHLGGCRECREFFVRREALARDLLTLGRAADAIADAAPTTARRLVRWRSWSLAAAMLLFFLTAGLYLTEFRHVGPGPGAVPPEGNAPPITEPMPNPPSARDFSVTCPEGRMLVPMTSNNPRIHIVWLYDQTVLPETPADGEPVRHPASSD